MYAISIVAVERTATEGYEWLLCVLNAATTEIYTILFVGSVGCVSGTAFHTFSFGILGLHSEEGGNNEALDGVMNMVLDIRKAAKENKDWPTADKIRDGLKDAGVEVMDGKEGSTYKLN